MYKFLFLAVSLLFLTSCTSDVEIPQQQLTEDDILGEWQLVRTFGQTPNSERTGDEMHWQESYTLRADGTFSKKRVLDGETFVAEGTYVLNYYENADGQSNDLLISLIYPSENALIGSCYIGSLKEELWFRTQELLVSTWHQFDGWDWNMKKRRGNKGPSQ